ncbi:hypothetical protein D3C71_1537610 [compost metagenome]
MGQWLERVAEHDALKRRAILCASHVLEWRVISADPHVVVQMRSNTRAERHADHALPDEVVKVADRRVQAALQANNRTQPPFAGKPLQRFGFR